MESLRNYINLFESIEEDCGDDIEKVEETFDHDEVVAEDTLTEFDAAPMADEAGLEGALDPRGLAKLLPEVDDVNRFINAVRKVQKGDIAAISISENRQLAKAFISLLKDDSNDTMKIMQKLRMVHTKSAMESAEEEDGEQIDEVFGLFGGKKKKPAPAAAKPQQTQQPRRRLTPDEIERLEQETGVRHY